MAYTPTFRVKYWGTVGERPYQVQMENGAREVRWFGDVDDVASYIIERKPASVTAEGLSSADYQMLSGNLRNQKDISLAQVTRRWTGRQ